MTQEASPKTQSPQSQDGWARACDGEVRRPGVSATDTPDFLGRSPGLSTPSVAQAENQEIGQVWRAYICMPNLGNHCEVRYRSRHRFRGILAETLEAKEWFDVTGRSVAICRDVLTERIEEEGRGVVRVRVCTLDALDALDALDDLANLILSTHDSQLSFPEDAVMLCMQEHDGVQ